MLVQNHEKNEITIKQNPIFLGIGIVCIIMAIAGIRLLPGTVPLEEGYATSDWVGFVFVCVWLLVVLGMGGYALTTNSKRVIINDTGVLSKTWCSKSFLPWAVIQDWGLSYCGQTRWEGNTYYLYFSRNIHPIKNAHKKKLRGKMIKTFVIGTDYSEAVRKIIPFCVQRTAIKPFIGEDKFHFL